MVAEPELLTTDGRRRGPPVRTAAVALVVLAWVLIVTRSGDRASLAVTTRALDPQENLRVRTVSVVGISALRLAADVQALTPGRIGCGSPGPADVVWLESAALHDHLARALR